MKLPPPGDRRCRVARSLAAAAFLGLAPKCVLCLAAYATVGAGLAAGGSELCGAAPGTGQAGLSLLAAGGALVGLAAAWIGFRPAPR